MLDKAIKSGKEKRKKYPTLEFAENYLRKYYGVS